MRIGTFEFRPGLWPTLATMILLPFLFGLGIWQLERASWKQTLVDAHAARAREPAVALSSVLPATAAGEYRNVTVEGHYDLEHQLLLDNRLYRGRAGYQVLTPLHLEDAGTTVLVNRGWVPAGASRAVLPALDGPAGTIRLAALVRLPPEKIFRLGTEEERHAGWPQVIQAIDIAALEERLGYALLPLVLLLDQGDVHGYVRDWQPVYGVKPEKHRAYAMQWFTLAAVLLLIYIGVNSKRVSNGKEQQADEKE
ncbi:MAG: SURF1 family protein [Gammaproteobacteria bacterium]|nr:SURF1 family protein [Gammaproteobacteria bacterium]